MDVNKISNPGSHKYDYFNTSILHNVCKTIALIICTKKFKMFLVIYIYIYIFFLEKWSSDHVSNVPLCTEDTGRDQKVP